MVTKKMGIASITGRSAGHRPVTTLRQTGHMDWKDVPTRTLDVNGTSFAYRALGPDTGVPVIFLHHLMAVLDDWDPGVIDGIAAKRRVIAFDNRGVGASGDRCHIPLRRWDVMPSPLFAPWDCRRSICSGFR